MLVTQSDLHWIIQTKIGLDDTRVDDIIKNYVLDRSRAQVITHYNLECVSTKDYNV